MALTNKQIKDYFGDFKYTELSHGFVAIDPEWVKANIVTVALSTFHKTVKVPCHKKVKKALLNIFAALKDKGLLQNIHTIDGCFVPRHVRRDKNKPLSEHAYAIAIDINASIFPYGCKYEQDPAVVAVFAKFNFKYGGGHSSKAVAAHKENALWAHIQDPMHFSYDGPPI